MAPHSTFLRRLGFLGSFRLLILLRTRLRYFMSVLFSSWKICGVRQGIKWGMPAWVLLSPGPVVTCRWLISVGLSSAWEVSPSLALRG